MPKKEDFDRHIFCFRSVFKDRLIRFCSRHETYSQFLYETSNLWSFFLEAGSTCTPGLHWINLLQPYLFEFIFPSILALLLLLIVTPSPPGSLSRRRGDSLFPLLGETRVEVEPRLLPKVEGICETSWQKGQRKLKLSVLSRLLEKLELL